MGKRLVILESPFAGNVEENINYAKKCIHDCLKREEAPIASHLLYTQPGILDDDNTSERILGIEAGLAWYKVAEAAVVYIDFGISKGMREGIKRARQHGVPIAIRSLYGPVEDNSIIEDVINA